MYTLSLNVSHCSKVILSHSPLYITYTVHSTLRTQSTLHYVHSPLYITDTVHSTSRTQSTLHHVHSPLYITYTVHSTSRTQSIVSFTLRFYCIRVNLHRFQSVIISNGNFRLPIFCTNYVLKQRYKCYTPSSLLIQN